MTTLRPKRARLADALAAIASHDYADAPSAAVGAVEEYERTGDAHVIEYMLGELSLSPADAWELLATHDVIPFAWLDDPRRFEALGPERDKLVYTTAGGSRAVGRVAAPREAVELPYPATLAACVAFASDVPSVLTAEAVARQHAALNVSPRVDRVVWRTMPRADAELRYLERDADFPKRNLFELGYALDSVGVESIVLVCPALVQP